MERKTGFFTTLKQEVSRGLSPAGSRSRSKSPHSGLLRRRKSNHHPDQFVYRSGSLRPSEALPPLREGPDPNEVKDGGDSKKWGHWMKGQLCRAPSPGNHSTSTSSCSNNQRSDLSLMLGVLGAPLAPVHVSCSQLFANLTIKDTPIVITLITLFLFFFFFLNFFFTHKFLFFSSCLVGSCFVGS